MHPTRVSKEECGGETCNTSNQGKSEGERGRVAMTERQPERERHASNTSITKEECGGETCNTSNQGTVRERERERQ